MWYIYTIEFYLAIKRNEVPTHVNNVRNLENMLSERNQSQQANYHTIPFIRSDQNRQIHINKVKVD